MLAMTEQRSESKAQQHRVARQAGGRAVRHTWFWADTMPLTEGGLISVRYLGTYREAAPAPTPASSLPAYHTSLQQCGSMCAHAMPHAQMHVPRLDVCVSIATDT